VLVIVVLAAVMSLVAIVFELIEAKAAGPHHMLTPLLFAFVTVVGSWLLLPMLFGLTYASAYYGAEPDNGLAFPGSTQGFEPDHTDFLYFSFTIAVTAQTSDIGVTTRAMRQLYITYAEQRRLYGVDTYGQPSRFIGELPAELVEEIRPRLQVSRPVFVRRSSSLEESPSPSMRMGSRVRHSKFGDGVVLNFEGNGPHARIQVNFERQGTKWLMMSYANLVRVE